MLLLVILAWIFTGPAQPGWARKAGTPASLLGGSRSAASSASAVTVPFEGALSGTIVETPTDGYRTRITIDASLSHVAYGRVHVMLEGSALDNGGVQMDRSVATLGTSASPALYRGAVTALDGATLRARVTATNGGTLDLSMDLSINPVAGTVTGSLSASGAS